MQNIVLYKAGCWALRWSLGVSTGHLDIDPIWWMSLVLLSDVETHIFLERDCFIDDLPIRSVCSSHLTVVRYTLRVD